jgi:hypothetical protein
MPIVFKFMGVRLTLDLAYLLDFKALAETGSFSRALSERDPARLQPPHPGD